MIIMILIMEMATAYDDQGASEREDPVQQGEGNQGDHDDDDDGDDD